MIQRIQSVYLLIVAVFAVLTMSFPVGHFYTENAVWEMGSLTLVSPGGVIDHTPWPLFLVLQLVAALALITIFLYKKRMVQIRITKLCMVLLIGYYVLFPSYVWGAFRSLGSFVPTWTICLPFVALVLAYLAVHAITKDENLVKSYDRLR